MNNIKEKISISDLAICGGTQSFKDPLYVGRPNIGDRARLLERINDLLDRHWLTNNGPFVQEFEQKVAQLLNVKHCIAICNATVALEILIRALDLKGEVIIPSFTFIATAHALQWQEITPVFCDIDSRTHTIDPNKIEELITPQTTGVIGVHTWGQPCNIESLTDICERRNIKLIFDAAHAFYCSYKDKMIGNFGEAEVFSFHATKFLNCFEGGAIVTNNDELAVKIRLMKNFGFAGYDNVIYIGTNGKMSEVSAAMGLTSLESLSNLIAVNRANYALYREHLKGISGISILDYDNNESNNFQYIVLLIDEPTARINRDQLIEILWAENVIARRYFYPGCHKMEPYRSHTSPQKWRLSATESVAQRVLQLPTGTTVSQSQIKTICDIIRFSATEGENITSFLREDKKKLESPTKSKSTTAP